MNKADKEKADRLADAINSPFPEGITNEQILWQVIERNLLSEVAKQMSEYLLFNTLLKRNYKDLNNLFQVKPTKISNQDESELSNAERTGKNCNELTEFEKAVKKWMGYDRVTPNEEDIALIKKASAEIRSFARKQFAQEIMNYKED